MLHLLSGIYHISLKKCQLVAEKLASNEEQGRTQKFARGGGEEDGKNEKSAMF